MKTLLFALALIPFACVYALPAHAGQERGAGNSTLAEIQKTAREVMSTLEERRDIKDLPITALREALNRATIKVVEKIEPINGSELDAENNPATGEVNFKRDSWNYNNESGRVRLLIHELLGLARIADPGYSLSDKLMGLAKPVPPVVATINMPKEDVAFTLYRWANAMNGVAKKMYEGGETASVSGVYEQGENGEAGEYHTIFKIFPTKYSVSQGFSKNDYIAIKLTQIRQGITLVELLPESRVAARLVRDNMLVCQRPDFQGQECYQLKASGTSNTFSLFYQANGAEDFEDDAYHMNLSYMNAPEGLTSMWTVQTIFDEEDGAIVRSRFYGSSTR